MTMKILFLNEDDGIRDYGKSLASVERDGGCYFVEVVNTNYNKCIKRIKRHRAYKHAVDSAKAFLKHSDAQYVQEDFSTFKDVAICYDEEDVVSKTFSPGDKIMFMGIDAEVDKVCGAAIEIVWISDVKTIERELVDYSRLVRYGFVKEIKWEDLWHD